MRVRADRRRAHTVIPEDGQFVLSARFVMPAVVLPTRHCIATTTTNNSGATTTTVSSNNTTAAAALYWLPVDNNPTVSRCCYYCGGRLQFVTGTSGSYNCYDASCSPLSSSPPPPSCRICRCDGSSVVFLVPYVLGPSWFRPIILPPAFIAAANHLRHHRRIQLYNTAVTSMETR